MKRFGTIGGRPGYTGSMRNILREKEKQRQKKIEEAKIIQIRKENEKIENRETVQVRKFVQPPKPKPLVKKLKPTLIQPPATPKSKGVELKSKPMYHERQRGGLCRMHAVNNLVGKTTLTEQVFRKVRDLFGERFCCRGVMEKDYTTFNLYRENVSVFALRSLFRFPSFSVFGTDTSELKTLGLSLKDIESPLAICWDKGHIWACRRIQGKWHTFDSRCGKPHPSPLPTGKHISKSFVYHCPEICNKLKLALERYARTSNKPEAHFIFPLINIYVCFKHPNTKQLLSFAQLCHMSFRHYEAKVIKVLELLGIRRK